MQVKNGEILVYINFLNEMKLKGKASIGRTNLIQALSEKSEELVRNQTVIIEEFDAWTDKEKGTFKQDNEELNSAMNDLLTQEVKVNFESPFKADLLESLEDYDEELSGQSALIYAKLYELLIKENE